MADRSTGTRRRGDAADGVRRRRPAHPRARMPDGRVLRTATRTDMEARLAEPAPTAAATFAELLERLDRDVLPFVGHFDHPRFFGYIPGAGTWPAALGDLIAAATNIDSGSWRESAGPSQLELTVLDWFRDWLGYPDEAAGVLVSGGSAANLTAIACAREAVVGAMSPRLVAYPGDQTHSSVARAARHLGFRPDQVRVLPSDERFRLRIADLAAAIDADAAAGRMPFLVIGNVGTTNTGAVDDLPALAALPPARSVAACRRRLRRLRGPHRTRAGHPRGARARGLDHARPAQMARHALRGRMPDGPRRTVARTGLRAPPGIPPRGRR